MNRWVLVSGVVLAACIIAYVGYVLAAPLGAQTSTFMQKGAVFTPASARLIPDGFPRPFIFGDAVTVQTGVAAPLSSVSAQYRVTLTTRTPPAELIAQYRAYFPRRFWTIANDSATDGTSSLTAQRNGNTFTITTSFAPAVGTTAVTLEYTGASWPALPRP